MCVSHTGVTLVKTSANVDHIQDMFIKTVAYFNVLYNS